MRLTLLLLASAALAGCAVGPDYARPSAPVSATYKEAAGWSPAAPADALDRGGWWTLFGDPVLNDLAAQVKVSNQNIAAAEAAYRQARALVAEQRAALFPSVNLTGSATRSGGGSGGSTTIVNSDGSTSGGGGGTRSTYRASLGASWEPDVWGRIRRTVEAAKADAQASEADLANATLSAQAELAEAEVTGQAGNGLVTVTQTATGEIRSVRIDPKVVDPEDVETLSDLIVAAVRDASAEAQKLAADAMGPLAGGMGGLGLPGM